MKNTVGEYPGGKGGKEGEYPGGISGVNTWGERGGGEIRGEYMGPISGGGGGISRVITWGEYPGYELYISGARKDEYPGSEGMKASVTK